MKIFNLYNNDLRNILMEFFISHLNPSMVYLLTTLRGRERDRATAFTTIGLIAVAVEQNIKPYLPKIIEIVRASLPTKVFI